jgi:predicted acetyltransferase
VEPQPISADEVPDFVTAVQTAFHEDPPPELIENVRRVLEPERTLVLREDGRIVAATGIYSRRLGVPGGEVPVAGVTQVGVRPTHRRRGLLTTLMRRQLADVCEVGREAVAALWASESTIYGRFGYGYATQSAEIEVRRDLARLRTAAPAAAVELTTPAEAIPAMREIHDVVRRDRPGMLDRAGAWWDLRIDDYEPHRGGASALRAAVVDGDAYALYAVKLRFEGGRADSLVRVREVMAGSPAGATAIWGYLLGLDLTTRLTYDLAPPDEPLTHLVTDARAVTTRIGDGLWIRLVDLSRALVERAYREPFEVVLEVADDVCPWNAGRWALRWDGTTADCARTSLPPALALGAADLGAAYLGGTTLDVLARAGRVQELRSGAAAAASRAFAGGRAPWCPEIF